MNGKPVLQDRVAVVTGGTRGLGRAIACGLADAGARVVITGRGDDTPELARELGSSVRGYACDVSDAAAFAAFSDRVSTDLGPVDVLVNNAGINPWYRRAEDTPLDEWAAVLGVNLTGAWLGCQLFGRQMLARNRGSIVNISSVAAHSGLPRSAAYCAAKGGLEALTRSLAVEWAARGVRVNCVAPGYFATDLTTGLRNHESLSGVVLSHTPMRRFGQPQELVGACIFLASAAASYITGQTLLVDGGWTAT